MIKQIIILAALGALLLISFTLMSCSLDAVSLISLQSANRMCKSKECVLRKVPVSPHRVTLNSETGVETWAWDTDVLRQRHADKAAGAPYWYEGYYLDCTYEIDFDPEGNRVGARWIGAGCFTSDGRLYNEGSFFYDE